MSFVSELIREAPAYKKAAMAAAVTAGVGACVYFGYRQWYGRQTSGMPRGPSKSEEKSTAEPRVKEPSVEKEELLVVKTEPVKFDLAKTGPLDRSVLTGPGDVRKTGSPLRVEELSTSVTFEKISLGPESDNFEHVTMSQINPLERSPAREVEKKEQVAEEAISSSSIFQLQGEARSDISFLNPPDMYENLSVSQADPSISFISAAEEEPKVEEAEQSRTGKTELQLPEKTQADVQEAEEAGGSSNDEELASAASVVSVKDENDIVVVETSVESGSEKSEEERGLPRSGMAAIDNDFDSSRVSPVFGQQTYQRVSTEPEELVAFDPAKSHPASFGFKFESNI